MHARHMHTCPLACMHSCLYPPAASLSRASCCTNGSLPRPMQSNAVLSSLPAGAKCIYVVASSCKLSLGRYLLNCSCSSQCCLASHIFSVTDQSHKHLHCLCQIESTKVTWSSGVHDFSQGNKLSGQLHATPLPAPNPRLPCLLFNLSLYTVMLLEILTLEGCQ